jgi:hypothetical protein
MKRIKKYIILPLSVVFTLIYVTLFSFELAAPRFQISEEGLTAARGPETISASGDVYTAYWHNDRTGAYVMSYFDSSALKTTYHIRWFASADSALVHLNLDWTGRDTVTYQEYPLELLSTALE